MRFPPFWGKRMNIVSKLERSIPKIEADIAEAERQRAEHQTALETAQNALAAANGDFAAWRDLDQKVRFEQQAIERCDQLVVKLRADIETTRQSLDVARRESSIADIRSRRETRENAAKAGRVILNRLIGEVRQHAEILDLAAKDDAADCAQLRVLGIAAAPIDATQAFWAELLRRHPGLAFEQVHNEFNGIVRGSVLERMPEIPSIPSERANQEQLARLSHDPAERELIVQKLQPPAPPPPPPFDPYDAEWRLVAHLPFKAGTELLSIAQFEAVSDTNNETRYALEDPGALRHGESIRSTNYFKTPLGLEIAVADTGARKFAHHKCDYRFEPNGENYKMAKQKPVDIDQTRQDIGPARIYKDI